MLQSMGSQKVVHGYVTQTQQMGFPVLVVKNPPASAGDTEDLGSTSGWERSPVEGKGNHSSILLEKSYEQRSFAGYSPWGHKELDTTEHTCSYAPSKSRKEPFLALYFVQ